uniref:Arfaptin-2 isoform X5 n=1 Tax=Geotrypetes seraphini TaxID=260995 RepID=A0A6P8R3N6_GEOSA|nr:arfaptin-2 isoform X5 [Geotrypetes seraphini]
MTDGIMSKAATMEIPINGNGDRGTLTEDESLEQIGPMPSPDFTVLLDLQQVMVSGPNLNETSIVSGGYGGTTEGIIPTNSIKGPAVQYNPSFLGLRFLCAQGQGSSMHQCHSHPSMTSEELSRGLAIEKFDVVKKWGINTYKEEFGYNAETQKLLCKNGETLLGAVNFFVSSINTLVNKTMEDTLMTVKLYETARLEYDAYRTDLEELNLCPRDATTLSRIELAQQNFHTHKEKYEKLRGDVAIKLKFLEENKIKVMHKQLLLFHNAISAYFAGNQQQLEQTLKQFNIKLKTPGSDKPSWLEEQ